MSQDLNFQTEYKEGFSMPENYVYKPEKGLNEDIVRKISQMKAEPAWMLEYRLKAYEHFRSREMPTWGADLSEIDFDNIYYYIKPTEEQVDKWELLPDEIKETYEKLKIPQVERELLAGVKAQYESEVIYGSLIQKLKDLGVVFLDTDSALREYEELFKKYFGTVIPYSDNKFASLNSAVWSGGSFIYIPKGVKVELPLQAYFRINAKNMGQFERTLIIADEDSELHYIEGCSAPIYSSDSLHAAVVEIVCLPNSKVRYTTIQNWSKNVYNLVTKRAFVYENAKMEWIDGNLGSKITMKYPSCVLLGKKAHGEVLSLAIARGEINAPLEKGGEGGFEKNYSRYPEYNNDLIPYASQNRYYKNATKEENKLWFNCLRYQRKLKKLAFQRQKVFGNYIVDFYCSKRNLVIEIDGIQHLREKDKIYDENRTKYLNNLGLSVIRFENSQIDVLFEEVCKYLDMILDTNPPYPPFQGGQNTFMKNIVSKLGDISPKIQSENTIINRQILDNGAKMIHAAPDTTSIINSKSVCLLGGRTSYRGLVRVNKNAENAKVKVNCDALILDNISETDTYPTMKIDNDTATIAHEATTGKVNENQIYYLMSRGLSEKDAQNLIVAGFLEPITKTLPMEYAVELNRLIELSMEGSVG